YPLLQGYDSVVLKADIELGGADQKFNLLLARDIQRAYGVDAQAILTVPVLPGIDGEIRMSKSTGNYIGVAEAPEEIYGKTLRFPDHALDVYYTLLFGEPVPAGLEPRDSKRALARRLVERFHSQEKALEAEQHFDRLHIERRPPEEIETAIYAANG